MSLKPDPIQPVPEETARVARAAFRKGNPLLKLRDELGAIFADTDFADLFPRLGQPGLPPWRLALVTLLQFRENLPDRQAAEAVRARIDWKYLLGLELADPGFDHSVLCEFRARLLAGSAEERLLHKLLDACQARGLLKARGRQRTDATHVLASIRVLNRLELLGETLRAALNEIAAVAPDWLRAAAPRAWYERYARRVEDGRLPRAAAEREAYARAVGEDGFTLLDRPGLDALRDSVRDGEVEILGVLAPDRLARKYAYQVLLLEEFRRAGCTVAFLNRAISDDPGDQLLLQIQGAVAEYERALLSERFRRGKLQKARAGQFIGVHAP